jgi:DNA ligase (NAD+)
MELDNNQSMAIIRDLNSQLLSACNAYYVLSAPIMTDAEYDTLEAQLRGLIKSNPHLAHLASVLKTVGNDAPIKEGRVKHLRPMLSIENQYTKDDVVAFFVGLQPRGACLFEAKQDGISAELCFKNGVLVQAVTRGTGSEGEDMTTQVKALRSIPQLLVKAPLLDMASEIRIRGELVMRDGELNRINAEAIAKGLKTYASTRNLTAGTMKQKDLSVVSSREIILMPWDMYSPTEDSNLPDSAYDRMKLLETVGFPQYKGSKVSKVEEVIPGIDAILELNAKSDIRADGVVIKVDSHKLRKELGVASKFTNWMTCFKPQSASGTTYLRSVEWQIGRQGALTPVAECDPVMLAGAIITRASLNNETWIKTLGLTIGCKLEMLRSGDVIPQIIRVIDDTGEEITPPTHCPECGTPITVWTDPKSNVTSRFCENGVCPGRVRDLFSYIGSREILEIDGLADDMATKIIKANFARNIGELFEFQVDMMSDLTKLQGKLGEEQGEAKFLALMAKQGFSITILKMLRSMEKSKTAPWNKWVSALGIPMVGRTLGKLLAKEMKLGTDDMSTLCSKLYEASKRNIEGMGDVKSDILKNWALDSVNRDICTALYKAGVRPTSTVAAVANGVGQPLAGVAFCITGEFDFSDRTNLEKTLESLGATLKSGVSKNLTHLIVGDSGAGKSKLTKYDELIAKGCKIEKVGRDWVLHMLELAGVVVEPTGFDVEEI